MSAAPVETAVVPFVGEKINHWEVQKEAAAGPRGKFNEERRAVYLEERRQGTPHLTAVRRAGISPATYDRYSAAVGQQWVNTVRYAKEEGLDPIRAVRRAAALEGEPWAVRAEIGDGRAARPEGGASGGTVNIGTVVVGGASGVSGALGGLIDRLRAREALGAGAGVGED
jgi:hypothetical protein